MKKQKVLFITQLFYPEIYRGNDVAFHLAEEGHEVHVVAGIPNYPIGRYFPGYGLFKRRVEMVNGVKVTRLPIIPRGHNNKVLLALNYLSYLVVAWTYVLFHALWHKYDCVFVQQLSPVTMSAPGVLYKKLRHVPLYTWVMDIWPDILPVAGGITNKYVLGFFDIFVKSEYKHSDKLLISSRSFEDKICQYGDYKDKIEYYPQWAVESKNNVEGKPIADASIKALETLDAVKEESFIVMFAGNVGEAQAMESNLQAALLTKEHKEIKWAIIGDGRKLPWMLDFVKRNGLEDTVFIFGRHTEDTMSLFFSRADVMLVSLTDSALFNLYCPAKISAYMSASRPIIAAMNGEGSEVVKSADCGWIISAGDSEALAKLVMDLSCKEKVELKAKGENGHKFYEEHFAKEMCLRKLDQIMFG